MVIISKGNRFRFVKLKKRPIATLLIEAALTGFAGNISVAGSAIRDPIAIDIYVEGGSITHCTGYLGNKKVEGDACLDIVMSTECTNCSAELTRLPPDKIIRRYRKPIFSKKLSVSGLIDSISLLLKDKTMVTEIILKGWVILIIRARIEDGLRALAELSRARTVAMVATSGVNKLIVVSKEGNVTASYLVLDGAEYLGSEALTKALQKLMNSALIEIFSLPEEIARVLAEKADERE